MSHEFEAIFGTLCKVFLHHILGGNITQITSSVGNEIKDGSAPDLITICNSKLYVCHTS